MIYAIWLVGSRSVLSSSILHSFANRTCLCRIASQSTAQYGLTASFLSFLLSTHSLTHSANQIEVFRPAHHHWWRNHRQRRNQTCCYSSANDLCLFSIPLLSCFGAIFDFCLLTCRLRGFLCRLLSLVWVKLTSLQWECWTVTRCEELIYRHM